MTDPILGHRLFVDGIARPVFLDEATGRQYVINDDGDRLDGQWLRAEEEADRPVIVDGGGE
jgi:hypothetical protein